MSWTQRALDSLGTVDLYRQKQNKFQKKPKTHTPPPPPVAWYLEVWSDLWLSSMAAWINNLLHGVTEDEWSLYHNASLLINIRNWTLRVFERCLSKNCGFLSRFFTLKILIFGRYVFIIVIFVTLVARFLLYVVVVSCFSYVNHALIFVGG
jgi:hypothetical protein